MDRYSDIKFEPLNIIAGVQPNTDKTPTKTVHYTYADKIRFVDGEPRKIKGWTLDKFNLDNEIDGTTRSLYSEIINGKNYLLAGTNKKLYSIIGSELTNITPLLTSTIAIADSLDTQYETLGSNPLSATIGSPLVVISYVDSARFNAGDVIYISSATAFAGLTIGQLNGDAIVREVGAGTLTINVGANATSTASGGGASVVLSSGLVTINDTAHGQLNGDRVKIVDAVDFGGILATEINLEFIIRNVTTDSFDVMTIGEATSAVIGGGGSGTEYSQEIPDGLLNEVASQGYGAGLYGVGLYGTALLSDTSRSLPRIWHMDRYGETIILTAGNQSGVYQWFASNSVAPTLVANAPTEVNYVFVSDNIVVTLGADGVENRVTSSDQGDITDWTSSSINQVFRDDIEGAGRLTSHVPVEDYNLLFTENKTYTMRYIGLPFIWEIKPLDETIGIIAPMARCSAKGKAFWIGLDNFYMYRGGTVEVIPANTQSQSTCIKYVFENMNWGQKSKFHAWYNKNFNEVWMHYASAESNECDRVVVVNLLDFTWTIHRMNRTASEYPNVKLKNPRLINVGDLYQHENGDNDDMVPLPFQLISNSRYYGRNNVTINAIIPDSLTSTNVTFKDNAYLYPQSQNVMYSINQTITPQSERIPITSSARFHNYTWEGAVLNQSWIMGQWLEELKSGSPE
jgi:hypothetical protein